MWNMVGADVPGGPRTRGRPRCRPVDVPWARRAEDVAPYQVRAWRACADVACVCGHGAVRGRGRRPRRPARPWASPMSFRGRSVGAARRGRRALPGARMACVCGRGACADMACVCGARCACADMACVGGHGAVRGRGRRPGGPRARGCPRCCPVGNGAPRTSRRTRCAHGVRVRRAPCVCGRGAVRGRGRRPGGPRARGRSRWRSRGRGAPRTSRPTMGVWCGTW